ncbi:MAG: lipoprotein-releasing ABC transporter permease subunit [Proteobacteria bacterium]|jgi:lipoprotein-releasing system permease protein|nr:lipoprotein-releasing ABC transporter permease subunit [Pseudomonadota bacterium]
MFRNYEWGLALKYLSIKGHDRFVTVIAVFSLLGIFLGVLALVVTMSVMGGFREEFLSKIIGFNGHMLFQPYDGKMSDYERATKEIASVQNVIHVAPIIEGQAMAMVGDYGTFALVRGIREEDIKAQPLIANNIISGSLENFGQEDNDIVIGRRLADKYGIVLNSEITLMSPKGRITPFGTVPRIQNFNVIAIFEVGEVNYDTGYFFVPLTAAQTYFQYGDQVGALEITLAHADLVNETYPMVTGKIAEIQLGGRLVDWQILNRAFFNALQIEKNAMFIILTLIILVAVFNVISTMIMLVKSKTRDIAVLRTMGATRTSIMRTFFIIGSSIGVVGTFLGVIGGIYLAKNLQNVVSYVEELTGSSLWDAEVRFITEIPSKIDTGEVTMIAVISLLLSLLATIFPALKAANTDPVKALKYE